MIPFLMAVLVWSSSSVAAPPVVRFQAESRRGWAAAEQCQVIWQAEGPQLVADLLPTETVTDTVLCLILGTASFRRVFGNRLPDWGVGAAAPGGRLIAVDLSRLPAVGRGVTEVFLHEMVHALLFQGGAHHWLPTWLHEGAALRYSGEWRFADTVSLLMEGHLPDLAGLQGPFVGDANRAGRAYHTSLLAVDRLQASYGERVIPELLANMSKEAEFGAAFQHVTGVTEAMFYRDFGNAMRWRFGWLVLMTRWPALFILLSIVLVVGGSRKMWLVRRRLAAMDDDATIDQTGTNCPHDRA